MKYTTEFDEVNEICIIHVKGDLHRPNDSLKIQMIVRDYHYQKGYCHFLIDMRQAQIISGEKDTFLIGAIPVDKNKKMKEIPHKVALVYSSTNANEIFLESVAVHKGYNVKVFTKIDKAIEWFKKD
jgi:hypothetical protein